MFRELRTCVILFALMAAVTGLAYPLVTYFVAQLAFPYQAKGSLIESNGHVIGSKLIGQGFQQPAYFHPRPSAAGNGYDASNSSGSNYGPMNPDYLTAVKERVTALKAIDAAMPVPVDLVTASASGLDPDISPAAARFQAASVAAARHIDMGTLNQLITDHTTSRLFGILGQDHINVLELNRALDSMGPPQ